MLLEEVLTEFKRTHLEHIEDLIIIDGYEGGQKTIDYFKKLQNNLKGKTTNAVNLSVKWDGAPAVVCGVNPDNGKFFVGTKSVFNKASKVNYTKNDIAKNHGTEDLGQKLLKCLVHLKKLNIQGVYQGDLLFTDNDLKTQSIDGAEHIVFNPNTITYAVPTQSDIGKRINRAKLGIIFHTTYTGESLAEMDATGGADVSKFGQSADVFYDNASYKDVSGSAKFTSDETKDFQLQISYLERLLQSVPKNLKSYLDSNRDFGVFFQMYINSLVKQGSIPNTSFELIKGFEKFYTVRLQKEIEKLKTQKSVTVRQEKIKAMNAFLQKIKQPLDAMLTFYREVPKLKNTVLNKLNQAMTIGSFTQTDNGLAVTEPEGFVAVDRTGNAVKLVDRLGFSQRNFATVKQFKNNV